MDDNKADDEKEETNFMAEQQLAYKFQAVLHTGPDCEN